VIWGGGGDLGGDLVGDLVGDLEGWFGGWFGGWFEGWLIGGSQIKNPFKNNFWEFFSVKTRSVAEQPDSKTQFGGFMFSKKIEKKSKIIYLENSPIATHTIITPLSVVMYGKAIIHAPKPVKPVIYIIWRLNLQ
jgi:hypothetical protein